MRYHATNDCDHCSCGHRHKTKKAAQKCVRKLMKKPGKTPGAAIQVRKID